MFEVNDQTLGHQKNWALIYNCLVTFIICLTNWFCLRFLGSNLKDVLWDSSAHLMKTTHFPVKFRMCYLLG